MKSKDFKSVKTKVGQQRVKQNLVQLDFSQKSIRLPQADGTPEQLIRQLRSSQAKTRKDAVFRISQIIARTPHVFLPGLAGQLIQAIFKCLHDDEFAVFKTAAMVLNQVAEFDASILRTYSALLRTNLKLILNQSYFDNRRAFLEQLGDSLIGLIGVEDICDFAQCLADKYIDIKAIYVVITVIRNHLGRRTEVSHIPWVSQVFQQAAPPSQQQGQFLEQAINLFKANNFTKPISAGQNTEYCQAILLLLYYLREADYCLPDDFLHYLLTHFPYTQVGASQDLQESCFILNSLVYLICGNQGFTLLQAGRLQFNLQEIFGAKAELQEHSTAALLACQQVLTQHMSATVVRLLLIKDFQAFRQLFSLLPQEERVVVLLDSRECDIGSYITEISKLALRKQHEMARRLIICCVNRIQQLRLRGQYNAADIARQISQLRRIEVGGREFRPVDCLVGLKDAPEVQRFLSDLQL